VKAIYEPAGRAREYAPLAVNLYQGDCPMACRYCWSRAFNKRTGRCGPYTLKPGILEALEREAPRYSGDPRRVLLCFTGDPYPPCDNYATRLALQVLRDREVRFSVLTKAAWRAAEDFDLYRCGPDGDWFGQTFAVTNEAQRYDWEPGASHIGDRMDAAREARRRGIYTWASLEPVIFPAQMLEFIPVLAQCIDEFRVGKLNYMTPPEPVDWERFALDAVEVLQATGRRWKLKRDLAGLLPEGVPSEGGSA